MMYRLSRWLAMLVVVALIGTTLDATPAANAFTAGIRSRPAGYPSIPVGDPYFPRLGDGTYQALHYTLNLAVDPQKNFLSGSVTMRAKALHPLRSFKLDLIGLTVHKVMVDGTAAAFVHRDRKLTVYPTPPVAPGHVFHTTISYSGYPQPIAWPGGGPPAGWLHFPGVIAVVSEPDGARTWFPNNDYPTQKASCTFLITVPAPYVAAANGRLLSVRRSEAGVTYSWTESAPMSSYLATINIGRLVVEHQTGPHGLPIRNYFEQGLETKLAPRFGEQPKMIAFMEHLIGPYPFGRYGVVVSGADEGYALEAQTLSVYGLPIFKLPENRVEETVAHEIIHQWFGDSVGVRSFTDLWLKEGVTTYFSWLWMEHAHPGDLARYVSGAYSKLQVGYLVTGLLRQPRMQAAQVLDMVTHVLTLEGKPHTETEILQKAGVRSVGELTAAKGLDVLDVKPDSLLARYYENIASATPAIPVPDGLFGFVTYFRGALGIYALHRQLGDAAFMHLMRTYYQTYKGRYAGTADILRLVEKLDGEKAEALLHTWLYQRGVPPLPPG